MFLVGLVISLVHLSRYKKPAVLASVGFAVLLCSTLLSPVLYVIAHSLVGQGDWGRVGQLNLLVTIGNSLIHVVGYSLLIVAIFIDSGLPSKRNFGRPDPVADFPLQAPRS